MLKRVRLDLAFETEEARNDIVDKVLDSIDDAVVIQEGQPNEERGYLELEDCEHDPPVLPCTMTDRWEVGRGKVL